MRSMAVEVPRGRDALIEFIEFGDRANAELSARWESSLDLQLPILLGESPFGKDREMQPLVVREGGDIVTRCVAVLDQRYIRHWNEKLGHVSMFEALPGRAQPVRDLLDAACVWLEERGLEAARAGFGMPFEMPFRIDAYDVLPPSMLRQNPPDYHALIKGAGFESERGFVDYKARITPELVERWEGAVEACRRADFEIVPLADLPPGQRLRDFAQVFSDAFKVHWGWSPMIEEEFAEMFAGYSGVGVLDTSVLAYREGRAVGSLFVVEDDIDHVRLARGRKLADHEKLNVLGIGVHESARGRGVSYAMAGYALLELARRGHTHVSYTLVLDDNWPSRRTGVGLGCEVCANFLAYRRDFRH